MSALEKKQKSFDKIIEDHASKEALTAAELDAAIKEARAKANELYKSNDFIPLFYISNAAESRTKMACRLRIGQ